MTGRRVPVERNLRGQQLPQSKLTDDDVRIMRALHSDGFPTTHIAPKFDVNQATAWRVCNYATWKHVT